MLPLTVRQRAGVIASSATEGRDAFYALDGTLLTYWRPREDDPHPTLTVDMMAPYIVGGVRIIWRDIGLDEKNGALRGPYHWILEGRPDNDSDEWVMLLDAGGNRYRPSCRLPRASAGFLRERQAHRMRSSRQGVSGGHRLHGFRKTGREHMTVYP